MTQPVAQSAPLNFILNMRAKPWDDIRVRRAVSLGIDREAVARVIRGGWFPGTSYLVPTTPWALPDSEAKTWPGFRQPKDQDVAEAKKLLAEAGYPQGFKINLLATNTISVQEASVGLQNELAKLGIQATIRPTENVVVTQRLMKGEYDCSVGSDSTPDTDPDVVLTGYVTGTPTNYGPWSNPKFDELYEAQSRALDVAKRKQLVVDAQKLIHEDAPKVVLAWAKRWAVWWDDVKEWKPENGPYFHHKMEIVWLDK